MTTNASIRVALYSRVSTVQQDDQGQYEELLKLCERSGWELVETYREKISGTKSANERPELKRLLLAAKQRRFQKLVVWDVSRLGRSMRHLINTLGDLHDCGVDVFSFKNGVDTSTPMGQALWQFLGIFAEMENTLRRERISLGIAKAKANGVKFGRPKMPAKKRQKMQKQIVELRKAGLSYGAIQRQLRCSMGLVGDTLIAHNPLTRLKVLDGR